MPIPRPSSAPSTAPVRTRILGRLPPRRPSMTDTSQSKHPAHSDPDPAALRRELADLRQKLAEQDRELVRVRASEDQLRVLVECTKCFFWVASLDMTAIHYV